MNTTTYRTRQMSFEDIQDKKKKRYIQILDRLITGPQTAKEIEQRYANHIQKIN